MQRINFQPISKIEHTDGSLLLVHSIFFTIQGEGPNVGKPAVFVRLGGCNLQCPGCDTEYTHSAAYEPVDSICTRIRMAFGKYAGPRLVVITGGEPFRQNLYQLVHHLRESYITVQIESNGTIAMQDLDKWVDHLFWGPTRPQVVVSPKAGKVNMDLWPWITAYKYVLDANHIDSKDGLPESVLGMPAKPARPHEGFDGPVYVQPAEESCIKYAMHQGGIHVKQLHDVANQANVEAVVKSAMTHGYTVCLQTHKILEVA